MVNRVHFQLAFLTVSIGQLSSLTSLSLTKLSSAFNTIIYQLVWPQIAFSVALRTLQDTLSCLTIVIYVDIQGSSRIERANAFKADCASALTSYTEI